MKDIDDVIMLDREVAYMRQRADALKACLYPSGIRYDGVKVQTSPSGDSMAEVIAEIDEIERVIEHKATIERAELVRELEAAFDTLDDMNQKTALIGYYCANKRVYKIADEMHYSRSKVYDCIQKGTAALYESGHFGQIGQVGQEDIC